MRKGIIKGFIFLIMALVTILVTSLLIPKTDAKVDRVYGFKLKENQNLDIIAFGNSDLFNGFVPAVLYDEFGYTSYNSGKSKEKLAEEYRFVKESFKYQSPKLIILEVDNITKGAGVDKSYDGVKGIASKIMMNHDYWRQASPDDIIDQKGYLYGDKVKGYFGGSDYLNTNAVSIGNNAFKTLEKITKYVKKQGVPVLFVELPSATLWSHTRHEKMVEFANEMKCDFIDFNYDFDKTLVDLTTDTRDGGDHLNIYGATKCTRYIGNFVKDKYNITPGDKNESFEKAAKELKALTDYSKI